MEKATSSRTYSPALDTSAESEPSDVPTSPRGSIVDAYPENPVVRYIVTPFARHPLKTILALLVFLFGSLTVCGYQNSEQVCDRRFHYTTLVIGAGLASLTGYTYYLREKLAKQQGPRKV